MMDFNNLFHKGWKWCEGRETERCYPYHLWKLFNDFCICTISTLKVAFRVQREGFALFVCFFFLKKSSLIFQCYMKELSQYMLFFFLLSAVLP